MLEDAPYPQEWVDNSDIPCEHDSPRPARRPLARQMPSRCARPTCGSCALSWHLAASLLIFFLLLQRGCILCHHETNSSLPWMFGNINVKNLTVHLPNAFVFMEGRSSVINNPSGDIIRARLGKNKIDPGCHAYKEPYSQLIKTPYLLLVDQQNSSAKYVKDSTQKWIAWPRQALTWGRQSAQYAQQICLSACVFCSPKTMMSEPVTPTAVVPLRTASSAYSTWQAPIPVHHPFQ